MSYCKFCIYTHPVNSNFKFWQEEEEEEEEETNGLSPASLDQGLN